PSGDGPRSTPAFNDGFVYALGGSGDLACLEAVSGDVRWQLNILKEFGADNIAAGISESVLIDGPQLICTPGGKIASIVALDKTPGTLIWKTLAPGADPAAYASANVAEVGGIRQYVQFMASGLVGVRAIDGRFLWRDNSSSNTRANCSSPLVIEDFVFSASG